MTKMYGSRLCHHCVQLLHEIFQIVAKFLHSDTGFEVALKRRRAFITEVLSVELSRSLHVFFHDQLLKLEDQQALK